MILLIGPSSVGKDAILQKLLTWDATLREVVSHTTREPRDIAVKPRGLAKEQNGIHYHFVDVEEFKRLDQNGEFLETNQYSENYYGTSKREVQRIEREGNNPIEIIDVNGADSIVQQFRTEGKDITTIFIQPPSEEELEKRMKKRGMKDEADMKRRLETAKEELAHAFKYDYQIVNDRLDVAATRILNIIHEHTGY